MYLTVISWSQTFCPFIQNCMLGPVQEQVWIGSQDSVIYIIDTQSMSCNKQLTEHRQEVTGLTVDSGEQPDR